MKLSECYGKGLVALGTLASSAAVFAQEAGEVVAEAAAKAGGEAGTQLTLRSLMEQGGWIMNVIALLSIVAVALIIFYLLTLRANVLYPKAFIHAAQDAAEAGDLDALKAICMDSNSAAAKVVMAAVEQTEANPKAFDYDRVRAAMEDEGSRQGGVLWQRLQYLMDVGVISPMVGLLGTVWGMMVSFGGLESGLSIINKADALANGVAQAMYTTFGGLIVGIFSMAAYDILRGRLMKLLGNMESECGSVLRRMTGLKK